ncbi:hypothetical protein [Lysinibacillus sp. Bpr_S20]|uniref:hypothetical protein n=1 Tax=Lysinibacillus sp. Bpr_S20 TaxID=2933964 RepID=UPI0020135718|nr:hypothetical protein [Lysinibacillus sp. Bpr_S20]MCL1700763.1 hypothetical protein [Lysinibacillus sp. Bpr_S20]
MYEIIEVELIEYDSNKHEYIGISEGNKILVDPFVGCVWNHRIRGLGKFTFKGHWFRDCFIVSEQIK